MLERARCYALLGQRKTAIFDFTAILKEHPKHVQALCGRGFTYLTLNQQKVQTLQTNQLNLKWEWENLDLFDRYDFTLQQIKI